jgi:hypothetical protein
MSEKKTHFHNGTNPKVAAILEQLRQEHRITRIRVTYGDPETGKARFDEHDTEGYVGRSSGDRPLMLLVNNRRSTGGGLILTEGIVRIITTTGRLLYQHPSYVAPNLKLKGRHAYLDGELYGNFEDDAQAERWFKKHTK